MQECYNARMLYCGKAMMFGKFIVKLFNFETLSISSALVAGKYHLPKTPCSGHRRFEKENNRIRNIKSRNQEV